MDALTTTYHMIYDITAYVYCFADVHLSANSKTAARQTAVTTQVERRKTGTFTHTYRHAYLQSY